MGPCDVLRQNPYNAVSLLGHSQGVVSMWTPNLTTSVVKLLAHKVSLTSHITQSVLCCAVLNCAVLHCLVAPLWLAQSACLYVHQPVTFGSCPVPSSLRMMGYLWKEIGNWYRSGKGCKQHQQNFSHVVQCAVHCSVASHIRKTSVA